MTFRISPTPWRVDMDYILDAKGERLLRALPQGSTTNEMDADFIQDDELARYQLQLASCAPELLATLNLLVERGTDSPVHNAALQLIDKATTVNFQDGNITYRQLAHDKANAK